MLLRYWQHTLATLLVIVGLVLFLPASVFAQSEEVDAIPTADTAINQLFLPAVQGDSTILAQSDEEPIVPFVGSNHVFLPVVQTDLASSVEAADLNFDVCKTPAADAFRILDIFGVSSTSPDASYAQRVCKRWLVDVRVSSQNQDFQFDSANYPTSKAFCNAYRQQWTVYKKSLFQTSFTRLHSGTSKGVWVQSGTGSSYYCSMQPVTGSGLGSYIYTPPTAGFNFYRVAVGAYIITSWGNVWQPVTVVAEYFPVPR
jgi:hypothetical protein